MNERPEQINIMSNGFAIQRNLIEIIKDMAMIRDRAISEKSYTNVEKRDYIHLTNRLASGIEAIANTFMKEKIQDLQEIMTENKQFLKYDPIKKDYWEARDVDNFSQSLDDLVVMVLRENFQTMQDNYHILQAVKCMMVSKKSARKQKKFYEKHIRPFQGGKLPKSNLFKRFLGFFAGKNHKVKELDDLTLEIRGEVKDIDKVMNIAKKAGYAYVRMKVNENKLTYTQRQNMERIRDAEVTGKKFYQKLIKYTAPISYPLLGSCPNKVQRELYKKLDFNEDAATISSFVIEIAGSAVGGIVTSIITGSFWGLLFLAPFVEGCVRAFVWNEENAGIGSILFQPYFLHYKPEEGKKIIIEKSLYQMTTASQRESMFDPTEFYQRVIELDIPTEIEELEGKDFTYKFLPYVKENIEIPGEINRLVSTENDAAIYDHSAAAHGYEMYSALFCYPGERYVISMINKESLKANFFTKLEKIMSQDSGPRKKIEDIQREIKPLYSRLALFENKEKTHDYEAGL